jgi:hypothetical protein
MCHHMWEIFVRFGAGYFLVCLLCALVIFRVRRPNERKGNDYWPHTHTHTPKHSTIKKEKYGSGSGLVFYSICYISPSFFLLFLFFTDVVHFREILSIGCESVVTTSVHGSLRG